MAGISSSILVGILTSYSILTSLLAGAGTTFTGMLAGVPTGTLTGELTGKLSGEPCGT